MKSILMVVILAFSVELFAAPYNGKVMKFRQPDGTSVEVKLYGDEYYMRAESPDGYTLIRDKSSGWICYAKLSEDESSLESTGINYRGITGDNASQENNLTIPKHLDISDKSKISIVSRNRSLLNKRSANLKSRRTTTFNVSGNIKGLCIAVDFSDQPATLPLSEIYDFCNKLDYSNYGNNGSLRKYYSDVSGGLVDYQNVVYGYYRAPLTFAAYDKMPQDEAAELLLSSALNWLNAQGFDFSTLSTNPDGSITAINLMFTGVPQTWAYGMWYHQGYYSDFFADGVHSGNYNFSPANAPLEIGTVCHENGHMLAHWPDTYKYTSDNGVDGIGTFDLMCTIGDYYNPVPPNPFFRYNAGWGTTVDISDYRGLITETANSGTYCKYRINEGDEYFLIESRRKTGRSAAIPDEGLTIWHVNKLGDNQTTTHEVFLEHANNNNSDHTQACFHSGFKSEFSPASTPNSAYTNGDPSGLNIWNISTVGNVMTYNVGGAAPSPVLQLSYKNITDDNNGNGLLEPGETGKINILAGNAGQTNSGTVTSTCTALGSTSGYVSIVTPSVIAGVLNAAQTTTVSHRISITPGAPVGSQIILKFTISDGTYSTYFTKIFIIGNQIIMDNQACSSCSAVFYDSGGPFSNYEIMLDYTKTISPSTPGKQLQVEFLTFELEEDVNCIYDYMQVFDGSSTTSPLLGTYCGNNSPGTITSSGPGGSLTFRFHSDEGWRWPGWSALVSCSGTVSVPVVNELKGVKLFPIPSSGIIYLKVDGEIKADIMITDMSGKVVYNEAVVICGQKAIDLSPIPGGTYFMQLKNADQILIQKFIISK
jgi:M6 family metalloprotease-like protein